MAVKTCLIMRSKVLLFLSTYLATNMCARLLFIIISRTSESMMPTIIVYRSFRIFIYFRNIISYKYFIFCFQRIEMINAMDEENCVDENQQQQVSSSITNRQPFHLSSVSSIVDIQRQQSTTDKIPQRKLTYWTVKGSTFVSKNYV